MRERHELRQAQMDQRWVLYCTAGDWIEVTAIDTTWTRAGTDEYLRQAMRLYRIHLGRGDG